MGGEWVHGTVMTPSPSAATSISPVTCSLILAAFVLFFKTPNAIVSLA